jgi:hypothetical protein
MPAPARAGAVERASQPPPGVAAAGSNASLSWFVRALLALAAVLSVAAIFAVWANRQLLDTSYYTPTSTKLLQNEAIRNQLSSYLTEQLYANVNLAGELESGLPKQLRPLAGPAAGGLRTVVEKGIVVALGTSQVQQLWRTANEVAHRQFVRLIENKSLVQSRGNGRVVLDLRPIVINLANRFGVPRSAVEKLRNYVGEFTILRAKRLETLQGAARGLRDVAIVLPALVLFLFALAVGLSRGRRSRALVVIGLVGVAAGIATLIVRSIAGRLVVNELASTESVRPAAHAAWSIATSLLAELAGAMIFAAVLVALAGACVSRARWAYAMRRVLAPYVRDRAALTYGVAIAAALVIYLWGPIAATQKLLGVLVFASLWLLGVEMFRRQVALEFPSARYLADRDSLRRRLGDAGSWLALRAARLRAGASGVVGQAHGGAAPATSAVEQLERLAALRASGALTDEEFAAAKRDVLSRT